MVVRTKSRKELKNAVAAAVGVAPEMDPTAEPKSDMKREVDKADIPEPRRKAVLDKCAEIRADKKYFEKVFKRMREDMEYARLGAKKSWVDADNYTVPITNRFINQVVAALYAKNPKAVAKRKPKMLYKVWDGTQESAQAAFQAVTTGTDMTGMAAQILQEVQQGKSYNMLMDRLGKTLELLFEHFTGEDFPDFKKRMKAAVRRTKTTGVGYVELSFHRAMDEDPDVTQRIGDITAKLERIRTRKSDVLDDALEDADAEIEELECLLKTLNEEKEIVVTEGLVFDFPRSLDIIPHRACTQLNGFIGADYITREYMMSVDQIKDTFQVDVGKGYTSYVDGKAKTTATTEGSDQEGDRTESVDSDSTSKTSKKKDKKGKACVWRVYDKLRREVFWICDGYPDYLKEPTAPEIIVNGFWPIFTLLFNEVEDEEEIYPPSDVHFLKHPQREYNNARQGLREHRKANRPKYFAKKGALEEEEKTALEGAPAHAVIELKGIEDKMTIEQLIQPYKGVPIDVNLYETQSIMRDVLFGVGSQEADLGQTGDSTATESSIAEQSRMTSLSSNIDELNEFLSELARAGSQVLLKEMSSDQVIQIVGPGAVWPELSAEQISKELYLEIKAGSTGRPNQAAELAKLERAMPFLIQLAGINPKVLAKKYSELLDIDEEELIVDGMPSIIAINAIAQQQAQAQTKMLTDQSAAADERKTAAVTAPTGDTATNPADQGSQGNNNAPKGPETAPQGQPEYTAPIHKYDATGARVNA